MWNSVSFFFLSRCNTGQSEYFYFSCIRISLSSRRVCVYNIRVWSACAFCAQLTESTVSRRLCWFFFHSTLVFYSQLTHLCCCCTLSVCIYIDGGVIVWVRHWTFCWKWNVIIKSARSSPKSWRTMINWNSQIVCDEFFVYSLIMEFSFNRTWYL